jgi:hypothetical protein
MKIIPEAYRANCSPLIISPVGSGIWIPMEQSLGGEK